MTNVEINDYQNNLNLQIYEAEMIEDTALALQLTNEKNQFLQDLKNSSSSNIAHQQKVVNLNTELTELGISQDSTNLLSN